jgi:hypothetical protein
LTSTFANHAWSARPLSSPLQAGGRGFESHRLHRVSWDPTPSSPPRMSSQGPAARLGSLCPQGSCPRVPHTDGCWLVVVGTGGRGRRVDEALEVPDDPGVLAVGHVPAPQRRGGGGVSDAGHQGAQACGAGRREWWRRCAGGRGTTARWSRRRRRQASRAAGESCCGASAPPSAAGNTSPWSRGSQ